MLESAICNAAYPFGNRLLGLHLISLQVPLRLVSGLSPTSQSYRVTFAGALRARSRFSVLNPRTGKTKPTRGMAVIAGDLAVIGLAATWLRGRARAAVSSTAGGAACLAQDT